MSVQQHDCWASGRAADPHVEGCLGEGDGLEIEAVEHGQNGTPVGILIMSCEVSHKGPSVRGS